MNGWRIALGLINPTIPNSATTAKTPLAGTLCRFQNAVALQTKKNTNHAPANWRSTRGVDLMGSRRFIESIGCKNREMFGFFGGGWQIIYFLFLHNDVFEHKQDHFRCKKTPNRVLRSADDRFSANVETGVHQHGAAGMLIKHLQ